MASRRNSTARSGDFRRISPWSLRTTRRRVPKWQSASALDRGGLPHGKRRRAPRRRRLRLRVCPYRLDVHAAKPLACWRPNVWAKLVRMTYIDEGGTSAREPFLVVGAVMVGPDDVFLAVEDHLDELVRKHIPKKDWERFVFHATDI